MTATTLEQNEKECDALIIPRENNYNKQADLESHRKKGLLYCRSLFLKSFPAISHSSL